MIVKMSRYDFVLMATQSEDFIARLRELGLVDITTTGWEPREQDRQLVSDIDHYAKAVERLQDFAASEAMASSAICTSVMAPTATTGAFIPDFLIASAYCMYQPCSCIRCGVGQLLQIAVGDSGSFSSSGL